MTVNTLGTHEQDRFSRTAAEWLWPLLPIGVSVFFLSSLIYYHVRHDAIEARSALQVAVATVYRVAGFAPSVLCFLLALTWSSIWFATGQLERPVSRVLRLLAMTVMLGVFLNVGGEAGESWQPHKGQLGAWLAGHLMAAFGYLPSLVLVWAVTFASLLLATDFFFSESFERLRQRPGQADAGVEVAVTEHLRGLGQSGPGSPPAWTGTAPETPAKAVDPLSVDPLSLDPISLDPISLDPLATGGPLAAAAGLAEATPAADATEDSEPVVEIESRRPTYSERRARRGRFEPVEERPFEPVEEEPRRGEDPAAEALGARAEPEADEADEVEADEVEAGEIDLEELESSAPGGEAATAGEEPPPSSGSSGPAPDGIGAAASAASEVAGESADDDLFVGGSTARAADPEDLRLPEPADAASEEPLVQIPRMDAPPVFREVTAPGGTRAIEDPPEHTAGRQQELFAAGIDERLIQEAIELVTSTRRASATLLQRKLRVDYSRAVDLLGELAARGLIALEGDASQGRVLG